MLGKTQQGIRSFSKNEEGPATRYSPFSTVTFVRCERFVNGDRTTGRAYTHIFQPFQPKIPKSEPVRRGEALKTTDETVEHELSLNGSIRPSLGGRTGGQATDGSMDMVLTMSMRNLDGAVSDQ